MLENKYKNLVFTALVSCVVLITTMQYGKYRQVFTASNILKKPVSVCSIDTNWPSYYMSDFF